MELNPQQTDALTELINIGYGRAANSLSELTGHRVTLAVPRITMHAIHDIPPLVASIATGKVASVNQEFAGPISGNALLLMDEKSATVLSRRLSDEHAPAEGFDTGSREIIVEVGNILMNACLGVFGNVLQVQVLFAAPRLQVTELDRILALITGDPAERRYGLVIHTQFHLRDNNFTGFLLIVLGGNSLDRMLREINAWENRQKSG